jgi:hypothetical protein
MNPGSGVLPYLDYRAAKPLLFNVVEYHNEVLPRVMYVNFSEISGTLASHGHYHTTLCRHCTLSQEVV